MNYTEEKALTDVLTTFLGFIVFVLGLCSPLLIVWALNALFPALEIPYTPKTWLATVILFGPMFGALAKMTNKK